MSSRYAIPNHYENTKRLIYAAEQGSYHVKIECQNVPEDNIHTLAVEEPYSFTVHRIQNPEERAARLKIAKTTAEILHFYQVMHSRVDIVGWDPINVISGDWYAFQHGMGDVRVLPSGDMLRIETMILLPTFGKQGITGELAWQRNMEGIPHGQPESGPEARAATVKRHNRLLEAFRAEDIDGILDAFTPNCITGIRDYVEDTGTLATLDGADELRAYYEALFARYSVRSVEVVQRLVEDWFLFSELLWTFEPKGGGELVSCSTAEYGELTTDGRLLCRIGHGTVMAPL